MKYSEMSDGGARRREIKHRSYLKHKATEAIRNAEWRKANREKCNGYAQRWRAENPELVKELDRLSRKRRREKRNKELRRWKQRNPERAKAIRQRTYWKHIVKNKEKRRIYYLANRQDRIRQSVEWMRNNPGKRVAQLAKRRLQKQLGGTFTRADVLEIYELQKGRCYWCNRKVPKRYHVDHIIPLAKNGTNDRRNIAISCANCNQRKNAKIPAEFAGRLF